MLYLLTATDGRPEAFALLEKWIGQASYPDGFRWIVGTRDASPYRFRLNHVVVEKPETNGLHPLCSNLLACFEALELRAEDLAVICEDDDYYGPGYLSRMARLAEGVSLAGQSHARYYNVATRRYQEMGNSRHASLCQTAFRAEVLPLLKTICLRANPRIDKALWSEWSGTRRLERSEEFAGIKGMPGERGIGAGHRSTFGRSDPNGRVFKAWGIPEEYRQFAWSKAGQ